MYDYDVLVVGTGPAGQKAAIAAAKLGRRVAIVERSNMVGGVCVNTGTIPSKTMRETVLHLTGLRHREQYGHSYRVKEDITVQDLAEQTRHVVSREIDVIRDQLARNHVRLLVGTASFVGAHELTIATDGPAVQVSADKVILAVGTNPARPDSVEFDDITVVDSDGVVHLRAIPGSMVVVGAGVVGIEYASVFAALGTKVTLVERREQMLEFLDDEIVEGLRYHLRDLSVAFRFGETVAAVERHDGGTITVLASGKKVAADTVVYSAGRQGATERLDLDRAGLAADGRGRIEVDDWYRTAVPHIYAVGDVIGFPALAATSMEQGRLAGYHACDEPANRRLEELSPIGIYTIPEISFVGRTEAELTADQIPYEVGVARYRELARGQIAGDPYGMLKVLVSADDRRVLGVHVFGTAATEIVHLGQAAIAAGLPVDYFVETVFNYPTLTEAYKVAALDATNKLRTIARVASDRPVVSTAVPGA